MLHFWESLKLKYICRNFNDEWNHGTKTREKEKKSSLCSLRVMYILRFFYQRPQVKLIIWITEYVTFFFFLQRIFLFFFFIESFYYKCQKLSLKFSIIQHCTQCGKILVVIKISVNWAWMWFYFSPLYAKCETHEWQFSSFIAILSEKLVMI